MNTLNEKLKLLRITKNISQSKLSREIGLSTSMISKYEKGVRAPGREVTVLLADYYNVSVDYLLGRESEEIKNKFDIEAKLNKEKQTLINRYFILDNYGKEVVNSVLDLELKRVQEQQEDDEDDFIQMIYYDLPASAGYGDVLFDDLKEEFINVHDTPTTRRADFAIRVSGNSMIPKFEDGDIIFIERDADINIGEIGVFTINGEGYIKEFGDGKLISLNPKYNDIIIHKDDDVRTVGKVIGKL